MVFEKFIQYFPKALCRTEPKKPHSVSRRLHSSIVLMRIFGGAFANSELQFIELLDKEDQLQGKETLIRRIFCDFLSACAFIALARAEDNIQVSVCSFVS